MTRLESTKKCPSRVWSPCLEPIGRKRKKRQVLENPKGNRRLTPGL